MSSRCVQDLIAANVVVRRVVTFRVTVIRVRAMTGAVTREAALIRTKSSPSPTVCEVVEDSGFRKDSDASESADPREATACGVDRVIGESVEVEVEEGASSSKGRSGEHILRRTLWQLLRPPHQQPPVSSTAVRPSDRWLLNTTFAQPQSLDHLGSTPEPQIMVQAKSSSRISEMRRTMATKLQHG
jgi:hypothetical protein